MSDLQSNNPVERLAPAAFNNIRTGNPDDLLKAVLTTDVKAEQDKINREAAEENPLILNMDESSPDFWQES